VSQLQPYQRNNELYHAPSGYHHRATPEDGDGKDQLEQFIDLIYQGKWFILVTFLIVFGASVFYILLQPPAFQASSLVMISSGQGSVAGGGSGNSGNQLGLNTPNMQWGRSVTNELLLLRNSQELPRAVAGRLLGLPGQYDRQIAPLIKTLGGETLDTAMVAQRIQQAVGFAAASEGNMIQFQAVTQDSAYAPLLANIFAEEYVDLTKSLSRASLEGQIGYLERQQEAQRDRLREIEEQIGSYLRDKGAISIEAEGSDLASRISSLESRRDRVRIEMQQRRASMQALQDNLEEIRPQLAQGLGSTVSQEIQMVQGKLGDLKAQRQEAIINNPQWENPSDQPALSRINRNIELLEETLGDLSDAYVSETISAEGTRDSTGTVTEGLDRAVALKQQIATERIAMTGLEAELEALNQTLDGYRSEIQTVPGESIQISQMERNRERIASTYEYISQRLEEMRIREQGELGYANIVAQASSASSLKPNEWRVLTLGAFFGILLGMGVALVRYKFDNRLKKPDQIEDQGYNATIVPDMTDLMKGASANGNRNDLVKQSEQELSPQLVSVHSVSSFATEAYRQLRTNLQFALDTDRSNVIMVTSPGVGEGKSTTAANLAAMFAQGGYRTVVVDADMRRPQLHNFLGLDIGPGLYQLLKGEGEVDPSRLETGVHNLFAITAGKRASGEASELVCSNRMRELLGILRNRFDVIVIDTPPSLAVSEPRQLARKSDATVLIARAGETKEKELEYAVLQLERVGAKIVGVVLNGFNLDMAYGYKYRYSQYGEYGHYAEYGS